jgi:hypothetical protein
LADRIDGETYADGVRENVFEPTKNKVAGKWRRMHDAELNDMYCSPNIIRIIKPRRMR